MLALRLAAVAALNSHPTIARLCEGRVYDSRIDDFDHREPVPVIVVTTEALLGEELSANNGGPPFDDRCSLVLEIAMNQIAPVLDDEGRPVLDDNGNEIQGIGCPATDQELEANLNLIGWCAEQILTTGRAHPLARTTPAAETVLAVTRRATRRSMERFSRDDTAERLAIHLVTFEMLLKNDEPDARNLPTGEFAGLPDPLRTVCERAAPDTDAFRVCRLVAAQLALPDLSPVSGVSIRRDPPIDGFDPVRAEFEMPTTP